MYISRTKNILVSGILIVISLLNGQKVVHMNGSYDLDGDKLLEFISLELDPNEDVFPTKVRYYEIDEEGYQTLVWEFSPPTALEGYFVDATIGDLMGNGSPNLIIVMNLSRFAENNSPHVFLASYSWEGVAGGGATTRNYRAARSGASAPATLWLQGCACIVPCSPSRIC